MATVAERERATRLRVDAMRVPTTVVSSTVGSVTITMRLYGTVTEERLLDAKTTAKRRAEQLQPYIPPVDTPYIRPRSRRPQPEDDMDEFEEFDMDE